jgi:arginase family enzyme
MTSMKVISQPTAVRQGASLEEISEGAITIIGVPADPCPAHRSSTALGPNALREALDDVLNVFVSSQTGAVEDVDTGTAFKLNPATPILDIGDLAPPFSIDAVKHVFGLIESPRALPLMLGGSRDLARACVAAVAGLDADIACVHLSPKILPGDLAKGVNTCFLGTHGLVSQDVWDDAIAANSTIVCAGEIHETGIETAVQSLREFLRNQKSVLWHIDAAVIDSGHAAGTPDLNVGGLSPEQLLTILDAVVEHSRVVGCVVTNVAPVFDKRGLSEFVAAEALRRVLSSRLISSVT